MRSDLPVIVLAESPATARKCMALGVAGVVPRDVDEASLLAALIAARYGLSVVAPAFEGRRRRRNTNLPLTLRETEVLELLAAGRSNRLIAKSLDISQHTAKFHVAQILAKLDADSRTEAVVVAAKLGLIDI